MKTILQHDERDCGAACLAMIASYYGLKYPISKYRELTKTDSNGTNLYGIVDAAKKIGFDAEALYGDSRNLIKSIQKSEVCFPFIAHIITEDNFQHYVVVLKIKNKKIIVVDPAKGKVQYELEFFFEMWTGYIVTLKQNGYFCKGNYTKGLFKKFFSLLKGQHAILASVLIMSLVIASIGVIGAFVFEVIIDDFYTTNETTVCEDNCTEEHEHITDKTIEDQTIIDKVIIFLTDNASNFNVFFIALIGLYVLQCFVQFLRGYLMSVFAKRIDMRLVLPYYDHILDMPMSAINTRTAGEYISRFSDTSIIRNAISGATLTLLLDLIMVIACGTILFMENKFLFLISAIMVGLYVIAVLVYRKPIDSANRTMMENNSKVQSYLKESIDGVEMVKSHSAEIVCKSKHNTKTKNFIQAVFKNNVISISQDSICTLIELVGTVVILWMGFGLVINNSITIGSLITFYALLTYFSEPIKNLIELQPTIQTAIVAADRLNDILDIPTEKFNETSVQKLMWNQISICNVDFRYGNRQLTLQDVSLEIGKGERIAIVGESGCGKTTLVKLLMKFYSPEKGQIKIDGQDISNLSITTIRGDVAYVDQNTFLFSDTIKNNLLLGAPNASDEDIEKACRLSGAMEFIKKLPLGWNTFLDENGRNLSGGQRQRLAIARSLLKKPKLLILDEATSNLDAVTESAIKDTIYALNENITYIIIAHRLSTIKNCDKIVVMNDGFIVETGTHEELLQLKGRYYEMYSKI